MQDKQIQAEKRELKMELYREREMRESLERQLTSELQSRGLTHISKPFKCSPKHLHTPKSCILKAMWPLYFLLMACFLSLHPEASEEGEEGQEEAAGGAGV